MAHTPGAADWQQMSPLANACRNEDEHALEFPIIGGSRCVETHWPMLIWFSSAVLTTLQSDPSYAFTVLCLINKRRKANDVLSHIQAVKDGGWAVADVGWRLIQGWTGC